MTCDKWQKSFIWARQADYLYWIWGSKRDLLQHTNFV